MLEVWIYTLGSVVIISLISFVGLLSLGINITILKRILIYLVSFSAGALFGDAFIHLLPEAAADGFSINISIYILLGIVMFFILEKIINWHHYHWPHTGDQIHPFAMTNLVGDGFHNLIDGLIIGAAYIVSLPVGIATSLAVLFHEIPQEIGDFGVLIHAGYSRGKALFLNFVTAITAIIGAVIALLVSTQTETLTLFLVPFAAGGFIYIAGSDLIPELHKEVEVKKSLAQLGAFLLGILAMVALLLIE